MQSLPKETPRQAEILEKYSPFPVETPRRKPALEPIVTVNRDKFKSKSRPQSPCGCWFALNLLIPIKSFLIETFLK